MGADDTSSVFYPESVGQPAHKNEAVTPSAVDTLYRETASGTYGTALKAGTEKLGLSDEAAQELIRETSTRFHDLNIQPSDGARLHDVFVKHALEPPDAATVEQWTRQSHALLREQYGDKGAEMLNRAQAYVKADPKLDQYFNRSGLGSHPEVIATIVQRVEELRRAGRLK